MSKKLLKTRVFSPEDWKKASRIERFYIHLQEPEYFPLSDKDQKYFNLLKKAFHIMSSEASHMRAANMISEMNTEIQTDARVWKIMNDVKDLFGQMIKRNKDFDRMMLREKFANIAERANLADELETERLCYGNIVRLEGLDQHKEDQLDPTQITLPEIVYSDNPEALHNADDNEENQINIDDQADTETHLLE